MESQLFSGDVDRRWPSIQQPLTAFRRRFRRRSAARLPGKGPARLPLQLGGGLRRYNGRSTAEEARQATAAAFNGRWRWLQQRHDARPVGFWSLNFRLSFGGGDRACFGRSTVEERRKGAAGEFFSFPAISHRNFSKVRSWKLLRI